MKPLLHPRHPGLFHLHPAMATFSLIASLLLALLLVLLLALSAR